MSNCHMLKIILCVHLDNQTLGLAPGTIAIIKVSLIQKSVLDPICYHLKYIIDFQINKLNSNYQSRQRYVETAQIVLKNGTLCQSEMPT